MRLTSFFVFVLLSTNIFGQTIKDSKILLYNYNYTIDDVVLKACEDKNQKVGLAISSPFSKPKKTFYEDYAGKKTAYIESEGGKKIIASLTDTIYNITNKLFKETFNTEILPINELEGKIKYFNLNPAYPELPQTTLKMVCKGKTDYPLYSKLSIAIQRPGISIGVGNEDGDASIGSKKCVVIIYLDIYDKDGNKLFDDNNQAIGDESIFARVNYTGIGESAGGKLIEMRKYICTLYSIALEGLIAKMPK